jgi:O-antigen/teichoic acid export membrane protein
MSKYDRGFDSLFGGTAIVFVGFATQLGVTFLVRVLFARYLSVEAFGLIALFIATINTVGLVSVAGLDVGIGRYLPRFEVGSEKREDVVRSAVEVAVPLSIGAAISLYLAADWITEELAYRPELRALFIVAAIGTPFFGLKRLAIGAAQGQEQTLPKVLIENLLAPVAQLVFTVLAVAYGFQLLGFAWAYASGFVLAGIIGTFYLLRRTPFQIVRRGSMHRQLAVFSGPLVVTNIMLSLMGGYLDTFFLGYLDTAASVGTYNTVYPLSQLTMIFLTSFSFLLLPAVSHLDAEAKFGRANRLMEVTTKWVFFLTLPVFFLMFYFPEQTIALTFGAKYTSGALALSLLVFGFLVHAGFAVAGKGLVAVGETRLVMIDTVVAAVLNIALNIVLIPRYGFFGAALASVISYWVLDALYLYQLRRHTGIFPVSSDLLRVVAITVPATAFVCGGFGRMVVDTIVGVGAVVTVATLLHLVIVIRYGGLSEEELEVITKAEQASGRDLSPVRRTVRALRR